MPRKKRHKKRKDEKQARIIVNASNVSNSSINIASDSSTINISKEQSSKWKTLIEIGAAIVGITGISLYSIYDYFITSEHITIDSLTTKISPPTSRTIERSSSHTIERFQEYTKDCTIVTIHKGDTIIKRMVQKQEPTESK